MTRKVLLTLVLSLIAAAAALAQKPPTPSPEQKKLGVFVGSWTGEGKLETTPFLQGGVAQSTMICRWYHGGYHVVCDADAEGDGRLGRNLVPNLSGTIRRDPIRNSPMGSGPGRHPGWQF